MITDRPRPDRRSLLATLGTPVMGRFAGKDMLRGKQVKAEYRWSKIHSTQPHWDQAWSPGGGRSSRSPGRTSKAMSTPRAIGA